MSKILRPGQQLEWNVTAGQVIHKGDLLWWNGTTLKSIGLAANLVRTWSSASIAIRDVVSRFVGVAGFNTFSDDKFDRTFKVDHGCIFEMPYDSGSAAPKIGTLLGPMQSGASNWLDATTLKKVLDPRDALGYCTKTYSSVPSTVQCVLFGAHEHGGLRGRMQNLCLHSPAGNIGTAGDIITDYTFGQKVKLVELASVTHIVFNTADTILTVKNGANSLDDTHTIATSGSAVGKVTKTQFDDANNYDVFEHDGAMDIATDGGTTAGEASLILSYLPLPTIA